MSDIVNPLQSIINQASSSLKADTGTVKRYAQRLEPKRVSDISLILLDVSGSMAEWVGQRRKIDLLRAALNRPLLSNEKAISFHSVTQHLNCLQSIPEPDGGTALHLAIVEAVKLRPKNTLIVSDGKPDDEKQAFAAAKKLTGTISTLYIGRDDDRAAIEFMRKLARLGCGTVDICDLRIPTEQKRLTSAIKLLLEPLKEI